MDLYNRKEKFAKGIIYFFYLACSFSVEFNWSEKERLRKVRGFKILFWYFHQLCVVCVFLSSALYLYRKWDEFIKNREISHLVMNGFYVLVFPFCITLQTVFHKHGHKMIELVNETVKLEAYFEKNFPVFADLYEYDRRFRDTSIIILGIQYFAQMWAVMVPLFILDPNEGRYLSSYFISPYYNNTDTKNIALAVACVYEMWFLTTQWGGLLLQIYINLLCLQTMFTSMKALRLHMESTETRNREKAFHSVLKAYDKVHLLCTYYNQTIGQHFLSRFKTTVAISCVSSAFILVKLFNLGDLIVIGMGIGCILVFVGTFSIMTNFCSKVHEDSIQLKKFLLSQKSFERVSRKKMKSYRIIGVKIGSFFLVKRVTPLTMLSMISNMTMTALISINFSL